MFINSLPQINDIYNSMIIIILTTPNFIKMSYFKSSLQEHYV